MSPHKPHEDCRDSESSQHGHKTWNAPAEDCEVFKTHRRHEHHRLSRRATPPLQGGHGPQRREFGSPVDGGLSGRADSHLFAYSSLLSEDRNGTPFLQARDLIRRHQTLAPSTQVSIEGVDLEIHPNVLSPTLTTTSRFFVQAIIDQHPRGDILEMGTGTGFCLCKIGLAVPDAALFGSDINLDAVNLTRRNLALNGLRGLVYQSDLYDHIDPEVRFDMIVFNPPLLYANAQNELERAIFDAGAATIHRYLRGLRGTLKSGGRSIILSTDRNRRDGRGPAFPAILDVFALRHRVIATLDRGFETYSVHLVEI